LKRAFLGALLDAASAGGDEKDQLKMKKAVSGFEGVKKTNNKKWASSPRAAQDIGNTTILELEQ